MKVIQIDKNQLPQSLEALGKAYRLIGPVQLPVQLKGAWEFQELAPGESPDLDYSNSRMSPKSLVFPQSEAMLTCSLDANEPDHGIYKEAPKDYAPRAVLGIRPCDAKSMQLLKLNFVTDEYQDPYWLELYNATTFVGLACDAPCSTCFCTSAGSGPYNEEGLDALMMDRGDHYLIKSLTPKGDQLLSAAGWNQAADETAATETIAHGKAAAEARIGSAVATEHLRAADTLALYNADFWEDISFSCINCGTCTFVCPTCWCFDIQDEVYNRKAVRMRNWDSCMFPIFTVHTTGHNPRGTKLQRVRQRFMHKLKYIVDKYDAGIGCVGCGRCVQQCPVNIDIRRVCELMNTLGSKNICAVQEK